MKIEDVVLYHKKYRGNKVTFNSRKGAGKVIEGIAVQVVKEQGGLVILRDYDNFPHCISILTLEEVLS
ncbi:hypothetical protein immuto35A_118 [Flavobacterium phage vB_FspM_immuto_3-5A]|jgi:hypothetical protein|uniref:Uncharacterized protein n=1 Tax=Flavobacterium phage vB_FspM_immuto_2-6A TaxID=2801477 RepID=A0A7T8ERD1_9CAUD|nr:hypothetical protein KNV73_gp152 [Flavobacterium phage vB_FspM_immuto_2-6A]QQO91798.1 hypothetical protein immuto26A_119 [Flavobacterium phage vB_FspM_immuto_2-6A]QQO92036.1 hypothetical protein immuto35A_118 [Flavobacterium phage vB_FspM_immuto_3-5A]QQO92274.1 hypothetical protein immuto136C_118 [Flavobacterium phage vB_FspM_immuto_13-6C]